MLSHYLKNLSLDLLELFHFLKHKFNQNNFYYYALLVVIGFLLYLKSLSFNFTYLDDNELILNNLPYLQNIGNVFDAFTKDAFYTLHSGAAYYRPLLTVSFILEASLFGSTPFVFHLTNVLLHLLTALLVFKLIEKLGCSKKTSLLLSLFFLVHPSLTQAVSWVPGRNDSLLAIFVLSSFIFFLKFLETKKVSAYFFSIFFFALGLFTKETALILPALMLFYLWQNYLLKKSIFIKLFVGWSIAILLWSPMRHIALSNPIPMSIKDGVISLFKNSPATLQLLGKTFFPFNLSVLPNIPDTTFLWGVGAVFLILFFVFWRTKNTSDEDDKSYLIIFGLFWFVLFLLPSFIRPDPNIIADFIEHRLYLPIIGLIFLLSQSPFFTYSKKSWSKWLTLAWILILMVFTFITWNHQNNFADKFSFWKNAAENSPHSPLAQKNLGAMYYLDKNYLLAEEYYKKSLALNELEPMVHSNLGLIYAGRGDTQNAEKEYQRELSFNPNYDNAHFNLGLLYYNQQKFTEAKIEWEKTLQINPDYADAKKALGLLSNLKK